MIDGKVKFCEMLKTINAKNHRPFVLYEMPFQDFPADLWEGQEACQLATSPAHPQSAAVRKTC